MNSNKYELVICIVNEGFSEAVMDAAKTAGATGGTVLSGHGTANKQAEEFFNISIEPLKDIVLIVVPSDIKDAVLKAVYKNVGFNTSGKGIAFSVPIDDAVGIK
ncbi:MAG: P-II family nitrogen regulator [Lachnospiraceae bacterium]|nr:P-II family nitrogen regulator [Lachnospiraceae bacterium]